MSQKRNDFLKKIRARELDLVLSLLENPQHILELGAGSGWQASILAERGHCVKAIDVAGGRVDGGRVFDVGIYDGIHIPFPDASFDCVFSSNVLEHVKFPQLLMADCGRVLSNGGFAIHVLPSSSWRIYTSIAHYIAVVQLLLGMRTLSDAGRDQTGKKSFWEKLTSALSAGRHGERGNELSEISYFSKRGWRSFFEQNNWDVKAVIPCEIAYSGYSLFGEKLTFALRWRFARLLGSSSYVWVVLPRT